MECSVGVSTETVLQTERFYTVVKRNFELTFGTVVLLQREWPKDGVKLIY